MKKDAAREMFADLERAREADVGDVAALEDGEEMATLARIPTYDVRLDAITTRELKRDYRIRVTPGAETGGISAEDWQYAIGLAVDAGVGCTVQNNGLEFM